MISLDLEREAAALRFLGEVLVDLQKSGSRHCDVRARFIKTGLEHEFRITYVGPSRRTERRPSMTGSKTRRK